MSNLLKIAAVAAAGFYRAGRFWPHEGVVIDPAELGEETLAPLGAEPMLHVTRADPAETEAAEALGLRGQIRAALGTLEPEGFDETGAPRAEVVRKALPKGTRGVTAALVAEVWAEIKEPPQPVA